MDCAKSCFLVLLPMPPAPFLAPVPLRRGASRSSRNGPGMRAAFPMATDVSPARQELKVARFVIGRVLVLVMNVHAFRNRSEDCLVHRSMQWNGCPKMVAAFVIPATHELLVCWRNHINDSSRCHAAL